MNWFLWALLSAFFAGLTAVLAKVGVAHVNSNLATAIRTVVILIFAWSVVLFTKSQSIATIGRRTWIFLVLSGIATGLSWLCYFRACNLVRLPRRPCRQAERCGCDCLSRNFSPRAGDLASLGRGLLIFTGATVLAYAQ